MSYEATEGQAVFDHTFDTDTELTGNMKLRLWVSADGADDLDLFVGVQKIDQHGERVPFPFFSTFDDGDVALGWLRVSRRALDEDASLPQQPIYLHQRDEPLSPGEVVPVEIEIWPSGTLFRAGETLRLVVQGHDLHVYPADAFAQRHATTRSTLAVTSCTPEGGDHFPPPRSRRSVNRTRVVRPRTGSHTRRPLPREWAPRGQRFRNTCQTPACAWLPRTSVGFVGTQALSIVR